MKKIALIPARSLSKRIPNKNIKLLGNHPLLAYTICSAIESKIFTYLWNDVLRHHEKAKIFNPNQVSTFGDLIKTFNQQSSDESLYVFSDAVHAAFDRKIIAAIPTFAPDEDELENDNVS